jgi:D-alanyl-D-alanine carboxypeptidase (penicillin-binding protein 5/6)
MPLSRRQVYRRRRITVFGGLALVLAVAFYLPSTLLAPLKAEAATVLPSEVPTSEAATIPWPSYGASAIGAVGYDAVLGSSGSADQLPMASIAKVITALVVLEEKPLQVDESGPDIEFTVADVELYNHYLALNGSLAPVRSGLVLSELQVLQLTIVHSANNYTASLVNWAFGSEEAFVPIANAWLVEHGLTGTTFVESTGIDPANTSTATDLVTLGKLALANPVLTKLVSTASISIDGVGEFDNSNDLLGVDGVSGLKTGTLEGFGANLLFSADYTVGTSTLQIVGVVLGGKNHPTIDKDITAMLAGVLAGFHEVPLSTAGTAYAHYDTPWGDESDLVAATTTSALVWSDTPITTLVSTEPVSVANAGDDVGIVHFTIGDQTVEVPLEVATPISDPGPFWRLTNPAELL